MNGIDTIIHLAGLTPDSKNASLKDWKAFYDTNIVATTRLGVAAVNKKVRRFIYVSTIKVNGEITDNNGERKIFRADDPPLPKDIYAESKLNAENALLSIAGKSELEVVIIRPPLVYGESVGGNFSKLVRLALCGIPLPFGGLQNERSLVSLGNLTNFLLTCITHPAAVNNIFLVSDGKDVSTTFLLQIIAKTVGIRLKLFHVNPYILNLGFHLIGLDKFGHRLCGSLKVDIKKTCELLSWYPPFIFEDEICKALAHYRK